MIYETLEDAITAAKMLCECLDTYVKVKKAPEGGYELFGTGNCYGDNRIGSISSGFFSFLLTHWNNHPLPKSFLKRHLGNDCWCFRNIGFASYFSDCSVFSTINTLKEFQLRL